MNVPLDIHWRALVALALATISLAALDGLLEGFFWTAPLGFSFMVIFGPALGQLPGLVFAHLKRSEPVAGFAQIVFLVFAYIISVGACLGYCYLAVTVQPPHEMITMFAWVLSLYFAFWSYCFALAIVAIARFSRRLLSNERRRTTRPDSS